MKISRPWAADFFALTKLKLGVMARVKNMRTRKKHPVRMRDSHDDGWAYAPPIFFLRHQKENAPCTVEKKKCFGRINLTQKCQVDRKAGGRANHCGSGLLRSIRLRYTLVVFRRLRRRLERWVETCGISTHWLGDPTRAFRFAMHSLGYC